MNFKQGMDKISNVVVLGTMLLISLGCTTSRDADEGRGGKSSDKSEQSDLFGDIEDESEAYPWLSVSNEKSAPIREALSQSPYPRDTPVRDTPPEPTPAAHRLKKASKRSPRH